MVAVFLNDLRLLLRDRWTVFYTLAAPVVIITIVVAARYGVDERPRLPLPIVDLDGGPVAATYIELLGKNAQPLPMGRAEAVDMVQVTVVQVVGVTVVLDGRVTAVRAVLMIMIVVGFAAHGVLRPVEHCIRYVDYPAIMSGRGENCGPSVTLVASTSRKNGTFPGMRRDSGPAP